VVEVVEEALKQEFGLLEAFILVSGCSIEEVEVDMVGKED